MGNALAGNEYGAHLNIELAKDAPAGDALTNEGRSKAQLREAAGEQLVGLGEAEAVDAAKELARGRQGDLGVLQRALRPLCQLLLIWHESSLCGRKGVACQQSY